MPDSVSVTSHHSYGSRVGNSLKSILLGILLVIVSIALLFWNEKNYVEQKAALNEGASVVQETSIDQINSELEGSEIHVSGETASNDEELKDNIFGVVTDNLKLKRTVEMYQWYEEEHEECHDNYGGSEDCTTTYTYDTKWSDEHISSNGFYKISNHENPSTWEYDSDQWVKQPITLGAYTLTDVFVNQLTDYSTVNLSEQNIAISESEKFHINGNQIYIGLDPTKPTVGDLRITFSSVKPYTVSIIGKQMGNELTSYKVSNGRNINLLSQGNVSAEDMFLEAQKENKQMTRIIRLIGLLLMYCGFAAMFKFIETLAKVLPFLANIIGVGTGIIALGLTILVGFITIGIAWLVARPIVGICCLVIAVGGIFLLKKSKKSIGGNLPAQESTEIEPEITTIKEDE